MLVPLMILAVLSIAGGWIGVPGSLGGNNRFDKFLGPVFHVNTPEANATHGGGGENTPPEKQTEGPEPKTGPATELIFTGISVAAALAGLYLAWLLYLKRPQLPQQIAHSFGGFYDTVLNKYFVDEFYAALLVKPLVAGSRAVLWHGIDQGIIDAAVDNSAEGARDASDSVRRMQSGNVRSYAGWIAIGAAAVIAYMLWVAFG
jgi:NADH-quinone oxidoreductase subunit L